MLFNEKEYKIKFVNHSETCPVTKEMMEYIEHLQKKLNEDFFKRPSLSHGNLPLEFYEKKERINNLIKILTSLVSKSTKIPLIMYKKIKIN